MPLAKAIAVVMAAEVIGSALSALNAWLTIGVMERIHAGDVPREHLVVFARRMQALGVLEFVILVTAVVLFCMFMVRANRNARSFGAVLANSPGWAAGWFFVPIASWWKPYYAMKEIWQASDAEAGTALNPPVPSLLPLWWWAYLAHLFVGGPFSQTSGPRQYGTMIVSSALTIVAAVLAAMVVMRLARLQERRTRAA